MQRPHSEYIKCVFGVLVIVRDTAQNMRESVTVLPKIKTS